MANSYPKMTDKELARATISGGRAEFEQIIQRYSNPLTMFALTRTGNFQDAEDIVQETFLQAYKNIDLFDNSYSLKNWLFTIAYRQIVSGYRKKKPEQLPEDAPNYLESEKKSNVQNKWIWRAAGQLGADSFTALWLRYKQEMTTEEISHIMNKTKIMVRVLLHRARKRLAKQIEENSEFARNSQWIRKEHIPVKGSE